MAWSLVAAVAFGLTQTLNRKSNQLVGPYRTAFGLLVVVEIVLLTSSIVSGQIDHLAAAPVGALVAFAAATLFHFGAGWTLLAISQERVGVARTGALVSVAPLVGALAAALLLDEPLTLVSVMGVVIVVAGVALLSLSGTTRAEARTWAHPWHALTVALLWGTSPILIRKGLEGLPYPILGLTVGIGTTVIVYALGLTITGGWAKAAPARAFMWIGLGGLTGAVAISAQWISFNLTTIAIALSLQQLAVLVVFALVPLMFREPIERINAKLLVGTAAMLMGTSLVVLA
ncbi:MAG: EamA family transporter [Acidimicrobiia bacterium]